VIRLFNRISYNIDIVNLFLFSVMQIWKKTKAVVKITVLDHFRYKHQHIYLYPVNFVPPPPFCPRRFPWRILRRRGCLLMPWNCMLTIALHGIIYVYHRLDMEWIHPWIGLDWS